MGQDFFSKLIATQSCGPNTLQIADEDEHGCVIAYECTCCFEEYDDEEEAMECCPRDVNVIYRCSACGSTRRNKERAKSCCASIATPARTPPMQCPICMREADSFQVAVDCCMHVHPTMTAYGRERVAKALANGIPWTEAVAANTNH